MGRFINECSIISDPFPVIQDSFRYQWFSYVISSPIQQIVYDNFVEKITHPAGFIRFADVTVHDSSTSLFNAEEVEIERTVLMPEPPIVPPVPPSDSSETRWCVAVIDEDDSQSLAGNELQWNNFRENWPDRLHFVLEASRSIDGSCNITTQDFNFTVNGQGSNLRVPDNYRDDLGELYANWIPVTRDGGNDTCALDWYELIGADRLPDGAKITLFVDNSGSMTTNTVRAAYDLFLSKLAARGIEFFVVSNPSENWISTFDREFTDNTPDFIISDPDPILQPDIV